MPAWQQSSRASRVAGQLGSRAAELHAAEDESSREAGQQGKQSQQRSKAGKALDSGSK